MKWVGRSIAPCIGAIAAQQIDPILQIAVTTRASPSVHSAVS